MRTCIRSLAGLVLLLAMGMLAHATTWTAASCNTADVQTAINSAAEGDTVDIPAGTCTWTSGVTLSGKGIDIQGAGSSRVIAISSSTLALATGSLTLTIQGADPGHPTPSITDGETLSIEETGTEANFMTGTVTSYNSGTGQLVMNITSDGGTCGVPQYQSNCKRWLVATDPASPTVIVNNAPGSSLSAGGLFQIAEDTSFHTSIGNFQVTAGATYQDNVIQVNYTSGGEAVLIHDIRITGNPNNTGPPDGNAVMIVMNTNRGVIWNCSFESNPYNVSTLGAISVQQDASDVTNSWTSVSNMGSLDTTGQGEVFAEDNDYHAMNGATSTDNNGRATWRYSLYDNSGVQTHGADTSNFGQRYFEFYNNTMVFEGYNDGSTFNVTQWFYLRGGTAVIYNNTIPALSSTDYGNKLDVNMTTMNLQRSAGPNPCWGSGFTTAGEYYPAPRQVGMGYVTGTGTANYPPGGVTNAHDDSITYVGDSEPLYMWGNTRSPLNVGTSDYGGSACTSPDASANYIQAGRDYVNGSTAKPGWSAYTWPHPLEPSGTNYSLTVTATNGSVSGTDCATGSYASGTSIGACTATPNAGYSFTGWSGTGSATCSGTGTCGPFSLAANSTLTASFAAAAQSPAAPQMLMGMVR